MFFETFIHVCCSLSIQFIQSSFLSFYQFFQLPYSFSQQLLIRAFCVFLKKKSREESSGAGSGVEILINEPYSDGPGGQGQYTRKIYHVGSHLPGN